MTLDSVRVNLAYMPRIDSNCDWQERRSHGPHGISQCSEMAWHPLVARKLVNAWVRLKIFCKSVFSKRVGFKRFPWCWRLDAFPSIILHASQFTKWSDQPYYISIFIYSILSDNVLYLLGLRCNCLSNLACSWLFRSLYDCISFLKIECYCPTPGALVIQAT